MTEYNTCWEHGGKGITNFRPEQLPLYKKAIAEYTKIKPNHKLHIDKPMYWLDGKGITPISFCLCEDYGSVSDLSDFWDIFDKLKNENYLLYR